MARQRIIPWRTRIGIVMAVIGMCVAVVAPANALQQPNQTPGRAAIYQQRALCSAKVDNPHFSKGAKGVIAKLRIRCVEGMSIGYDFNLWRCPGKPKKTSVGWTCKHAKKAGHNSGVFRGSANKTYTRYAPPGGKKGAKGTGYWCGTAHVWEDFAPTGVGQAAALEWWARSSSCPRIKAK